MEPGSVALSNDWAKGRNPDAPGGMYRLYVVESSFSITGASADHRMRIASGSVAAFTRALIGALQKAGAPLGGVSGAAAAAEGIDEQWLQAVAKDLLPF